MREVPPHEAIHLDDNEILLIVLINGPDKEPIIIHGMRHLRTPVGTWRLSPLISLRGRCLNNTVNSLVRPSICSQLKNNRPWIKTTFPFRIPKLVFSPSLAVSIATVCTDGPTSVYDKHRNWFGNSFLINTTQRSIARTWTHCLQRLLIGGGPRRGPKTLFGEPLINSVVMLMCMSLPK